MAEDDFQKVREALEITHLDDKYLNNFKEKGVGDAIINTCIGNSFTADAVLTPLISIIDHRKSFINAFKYVFPSQGPSSRFKNTGCPCSDNENDPHPSTVGPSESQLNAYLQESKQAYKNIIDKLLQTASLAINQFDNQASVEEERIKDDFLTKINGLDPKLDVHVVKKFATKLHDFMGSCFAENFNIFKEQKPDILLQAAMTVACKKYRDDMEKHFDSKGFIRNFQELSNEETIRAINTCNLSELTEIQKKQLLNALKVVHEEYKEKNLMRVPQEDIAIGIDLGTTYSCVSICVGGEVTIIKNNIGVSITPSYVAFREDGSYIVGEPAKFGNGPDIDPQNTCFDAKRLIGRNFSDSEVQKDVNILPFQVVKSQEDDTPKIKIKSKTYFAEEISARVLRHMKETAENYLHKKIKNAVVTVPAYFNNGQRQATRDAGKIAGLNILKIINEPTAAAIAYKLHRMDDLKRNVLIFDLGGGTFDVVVLTMCDGDIHIKAVNGDTHLGGRDFDRQLVNKCIQTFNNQYKIDLTKMPDSSKALRRIQNECERHKCFLSDTNQTTISIDAVYKGRDLNVPVTREQFENLNEEHFQKCIKIVETVLADAGFPKDEINDIVLVGGSTRIPKIQQMLSDLFGGKPLSKSVNPEEAVAYGAAIQASILQAKQRSFLPSANSVSTERIAKIKDVIPFSIGIQNVYNKLDIYFRKNTSIPCEENLPWRTVRDNQTTGEFCIYEGEDLVASNNHLLGKFLLGNIPSKKAGVEELEATLTVDDEGILHAMAVVKSNLSFSRIKISALQGRLSKKVINELKLPERSTIRV